MALSLALGGDALSDSSVLNDEPDLYGPVASNPTITRIIRTLADGADKTLTAINANRAAVRDRIRTLSGAQAPNHGSDARSPMFIDIGVTLVTAHSKKEQARPVQEGIRVSPLTGVH